MNIVSVKTVLKPSIIHLNLMFWFLEDNFIDIMGGFAVLFNVLFMLANKAFPLVFSTRTLKHNSFCKLFGN